MHNPTTAPRQRQQDRRDLSNAFSPRATRNSTGPFSYTDLIKPISTLFLIILAGWISFMTRYSPVGNGSGVGTPMMVRTGGTSSLKGTTVVSAGTMSSKDNQKSEFGAVDASAVVNFTEHRGSLAAKANREAPLEQPPPPMGDPVEEKDIDKKPSSDNVKNDEATTANKKEEDDPLSKEYDNCIVGAGLSGSVIAENYATHFGQTSLILEKRNHIGGNCYDYIDDDTGIRVSLFGAHLFHTRHERVWEYVQKFSEWVPYEHKVLDIVNGKTVPIPVTIDTVNTLFELNITSSEGMDEWLKKEQVVLKDDEGKEREAVNSEEIALTRVGQRLYDLLFKPYTFKQWAKYPAELGPEVLSRIPFRNNWDGRYFSDPHQALPKQGYTAIFDKMLLNKPEITVVTSTDYFDVKDKLKCKRLYYTGPVDAYFADMGLKKLEYRSLSFERVVEKDIGVDKTFQVAAVVNYPQATDVDGKEVDFTRIVEYKHLLNQTSPHTIYFIERSKDGGEPYYPVPNKENKDLYKKYQEMAEKEEGVTFVGRLANYKYFNMDDAILNALELFDKDTKDMKKEER